MKIDLTKYHFFSKVAIYTLGVVSILIGIYHLYKPNELLHLVPFFLPGGEIWSYMMGVSYFLVGVSFLFNYYVKFTSYLLALFLFLFVFIFKETGAHYLLFYISRRWIQFSKIDSLQQF